MTALAANRPREQFSDPDLTAGGEARAHVVFHDLKTLWLNTGTLCNIECANCYMHSSPTDDRLVYLTASDAKHVLDMVGHDAIEIGFTGGEPFMNPDMLSMMRDALGRGHSVLVLTNAMQPMQRLRIKYGLLDIKERYGERMTLRVSLDHHSEALHDAERGAGSFRKSMEGLRWLARQGFAIAVAGRSVPSETEPQARAGYAALFAREDIRLETDDHAALVIFPEMDERADVPEITTACWDILHVDPADMMCATSRMVVKRKGAARPVFVACTLLPDDPQFEMGETLAESLTPVKLNHRHCAKFCVLGGASCSSA